MTDKIKSLMSAVEIAKGDLAMAQAALDELEAQLHQERCKESGLLGKIVTNNRFSIVVHNVGFNSAGAPVVVHGKRIQKNGSAGLETGQIFLCTNHAVSEYINHMEGA